MKLSEILRAGKVNIETRGWCQGDEAAIWGLPNGPCCAATAISKQYDLLETIETGQGRAIRDLGHQAVELLKSANGLSKDVGIGNWNDAPERTKANVLAAYDKAIAAAEKQETSNGLRNG